MEAALGWIGAIIEWVGQFVPRWTVVDTRHSWIKWVGARVVREGWRFRWDTEMKVISGAEGIVWHWPAVTQWYMYPTARQNFDLRAQTVTTKDVLGPNDEVLEPGVPVLVGGLISYQVTDIEKAIGLTWDTDETIRDTALTALHDVVSSKTWAELRDPRKGKELRRELREEAKKALEPYGVKVLKLSLTDLAKTAVLKIAMSNDVIA